MTTSLRRRASLRTHVAVTVALAVLASTLAVTTTAYLLTRRLARDRFVNTSATSTLVSAGQLGALAARGGEQTVRQQAAAVQDQRLLLGFAVYPNGPLDTASPCGGATCLQRLPRAVRSAVRDRRSSIGWDTGTGSTVLIVAEPVDGTRLSLVASFDYAQQANDLADLRDVLLWVDAAGLVLALTLGLGLGTGLSRPVRAAAAAARRVGEGGRPVRVPASGGRELTALAADFNAMSERLTATMTDLRSAQTLQQRFVADVSHELRTPLATMVAAAAALDASSGATRAEAAQVLQVQVGRTHHMLEDLLEISRLDAGQAAMDLDALDLGELCRDVAAATTGEVQVEVRGDPVVLADARRLHAVVRNVVDNAVRHGRPPVRITVDGTGGPAVVSVTDQGQGVPAGIVSTVFDRFVRADASRAGLDGTGLGLAIAAENARLHGGTLALRPGRPTRFDLVLPTAGTAGKAVVDCLGEVLPASARGGSHGCARRDSNP